MKILMLGTYPIVQPQHGGQLRVKAILGAYKNTGIDTRYIAIVPKDWYESLGSQDIEIDNNILTDDKYKLAPDLAVAMNIRKNESLQQKIKNIIESYNPDIIECEQLFIFIGIEKILKSIKRHIFLLYSAQNVEYRLRSDMLTNQLHNKNLMEKVVSEIELWEERLVKAADITIVCTEEDGIQFKSMGAKKILLAPNGIHKRRLSPENYEIWEKRYDSAEINKTILFVGSAHMPNLEGFKQMVGYDVGFLPHDFKLLIAGDVYRLIENDLADLPQHISSTFRLRVDLLGKVTDDDMASLVKLADVIILPITQGGGSNLKTAEAILSGKAIVATTNSFRGYDAYLQLPNIFFADRKPDFRRAIVTACVNKLSHRTASQQSIANKVTWHYGLQNMTNVVKSLLPK